MAMVDYGCAVKKNGQFLPFKGGLFMECPDWVPEKVYDEKGQTAIVRDNFFAYVGDIDFYLCFYKTICLVCSHDKLLYSCWNPHNDFVRFFDKANISIKHIDGNTYWEGYYNCHKTWTDYVKETWIDATGNEKLSELSNGHKEYKRFMRACKRIGRTKNKAYSYKTSKFIASWNYNGDTYEVVYGYGIDSDVKTYDLIKNGHYGYTDIEIAFLDKWYKED